MLDTRSLGIQFQSTERAARLRLGAIVAGTRQLPAEGMECGTSHQSDLPCIDAAAFFMQDLLYSQAFPVASLVYAAGVVPAVASTNFHHSF